MKKFLIMGFLAIFLTFFGLFFLSPASVQSTPYGQRSYSDCPYGNLYCDLELALYIRNSDDTAGTNQCDLGIAQTTTVSNCSYRVKSFTNAKLGYTLYVETGGGLSNGSHTIANATAGNGGIGGSDISATTVGTERYGAVINEGSITGSGAIVLENDYDAGTNAVDYSTLSPAAIVTASAENEPGEPDTTNTVLVTHKLNISSSTPAGSYLQHLTYTLSPNF